MTNSPAASQLLDEINALVAGRHLLTHPFYHAWTRGELSREALCDYATQYYHHVAAFPRYLSAVHARTADIETRQVLLENLIDEERGAENHPELWLRFAEGLGLDRKSVKAAALEPETAKLIDTFLDVCSTGAPAAGVAALYAYESQIPEVAQSKIDGLVKNYAVSDERTLKYFTVHKDADVEHSAAERALIARIAEAADAQEVTSAVKRVLDALWNLLSGVCARHDVPMECASAA